MLGAIHIAAALALAGTVSSEAKALRAPAVEPALPGSRGQAAVRAVRAMQGEILEAQRKLIQEFKALPEADDIRINFDKNMYGWSVSDRNLATRKDEFDAALAGYEKDFKEDALVDELRIYIKRLMKKAKEGQLFAESRLPGIQKVLAEGRFYKDGKAVELNESGRQTYQGLAKLFPLELKFQKEVEQISARYETLVAGLMP